MKRVIILLFTFCFGFSGYTQIADTTTLLKLGDRRISKTEFERIYKKNNNQTTPGDKKNVEEYLELFINFKLKVIEAENLKMDTSKAFIDELAGYRKQLAKPYLTDGKIDERLLQEAYDRAQWDIKAAHILIKCDENAAPADSLKAYQKAQKARERILKGEDFESVAKQLSEDPSAQQNGGTLGYFTVFNMVYPFETGAYNTPVGEISMPVRSKFGYHVIKVLDRRANQGEIKVAHIMVAVPKNSPEEQQKSMKDKIFTLFDSLQAGKDFALLAQKYSDDRASAQRGGELPQFGTGRMIPEFESAAFKLQNVGDFTPPVQTSYGWHLIKLLEKHPLGTFAELKNKFKGNIAKDQRAAKGREATIENLKKEYKLTIDSKRLADFYPIADSGIYKGNWDVNKAQKLTKDLFTLDGEAFNQQDFAKYLAGNRVLGKFTNFNEAINKALKLYTDKVVMEYEDSRLEVKYQDFRDLMQEYHDGILLFELTDKMVWSKAVQDTTGLKEYYEANKQNYMWGERFKGLYYTCQDEKVMKKVQKMLSKNGQKPFTDAEILKNFTKDTIKLITATEGTYAQGDNEIIDFYIWNTGKHIKPANEFIVSLGEKLAPMPKLLDETRGLVIADYQNKLEKEWIESLRQKYPVQLFKEALVGIE